MNKKQITHKQLYGYLNKMYPVTEVAKSDPKSFICDKAHVNDQVKRIFVMLDCSYEWLSNSDVQAHDFLIVHHHLNHKYEKTALQEQMLATLYEKGVAVLFLHLRFDFAFGGMNDLFASTIFEGSYKKLDHHGLDLVLHQPLKLLEIVNLINKHHLPMQMVYDQAYQDVSVKKIKVLLGSGASILPMMVQRTLAYEKSPSKWALWDYDLLITGDMKWHDWLYAHDYALPVLDIHHSSEKIFCEIIHFRLFVLFMKKQIANIPITTVDNQLKLVYIPPKKNQLPS